MISNTSFYELPEQLALGGVLLFIIFGLKGLSGSEGGCMARTRILAEIIYKLITLAAS